ncbi:UNVERIFIED_CONTAM: Retrovirus-related Pol polyprotein from transposon TNT 1-94 [Sesamum indicum]
MAKSIWIILAIAAWYGNEIWKIDVKTDFLNGFVEEEIYMDQPKGFISIREEQKVCHLQRSIYGLKQASRNWNIHFDEVIQGIISSRTTLILVYTRRSVGAQLQSSCFVDDILLIGNDVKMLSDTKIWLSTQFSMKDLGEASNIRQHTVVVQCARPDVAFTLRVTSRYQARAGEAHWTTVKSILKYLGRTKDIFLFYGSGELILEGYSDASFQSDEDDAKSQSGFVFRLNLIRVCI